MADGYVDFTLETLKTAEGINQMNRMLRTLYDNVAGDTETVRIYQGYGDPEGVVAAGVGSIYLRIDGGAGTSLYTKQTGDVGNTGWVANQYITFPLPVSQGGTGADNSTVPQGYIPYFSGTGVLSALPYSTSGMVLTTQGAGADPIFALPSNYFSLVSATSFSSAASSGSIAITNTKQYFVKVVLTGMSSGDVLGITVNSDTTANHYGYVYRGFNFAATGDNGNSNFAATELRIGNGNPSTTENTYIDFSIAPQGTASGKYLYMQGRTYGINSSSGHSMFDWTGAWTNSADATSFSLAAITGGVTMTGTVYLYEVKTA